MTQDRVELPADVALLLERLRDGLLARGGLVGVYLYGSLVTGDFSPARSDIDVLVLLERDPDKGAIGVREELTGYWRRKARQRRRWLQDTWVDFGLITLPRAEAVLTTGDLITKSEAIRRLPEFGVPAALAEQIRRRRDGPDVLLGKLRRIRRAYLARRLMRRGIRRLGQLGRAG